MSLYPQYAEHPDSWNPLPDVFPHGLRDVGGFPFAEVDQTLQAGSVPHGPIGLTEEIKTWALGTISKEVNPTYAARVEEVRDQSVLRRRRGHKGTVLSTLEDDEAMAALRIQDILQMSNGRLGSMDELRRNVLLDTTVESLYVGRETGQYMGRAEDPLTKKSMLQPEVVVRCLREHASKPEDYAVIKLARRYVQDRVLVDSMSLLGIEGSKIPRWLRSDVAYKYAASLEIVGAHNEETARAIILNNFESPEEFEWTNKKAGELIEFLAYHEQESEKAQDFVYDEACRLLRSIPDSMLEQFYHSKRSRHIVKAINIQLTRLIEGVREGNPAADKVYEALNKAAIEEQRGGYNSPTNPMQDIPPSALMDVANGLIVARNQHLPQHGQMSLIGEASGVENIYPRSVMTIATVLQEVYVRRLNGQSPEGAETSEVALGRVRALIDFQKRFFKFTQKKYVKHGLGAQATRGAIPQISSGTPSHHTDHNAGRPGYGTLS